VEGEVVGSAEEAHFVDVGEATFDPCDEMVGVAPRGGATASGDDASSVADGEGLELRRGCGAEASSHVEDVARAVPNDPAYGGVAGEELDAGGSDEPTVADLGATGRSVEGVEVDQYVEVGFAASGGGGGA
jgi:hypothetical protein